MKTFETKEELEAHLRLHIPIKFKPKSRKRFVFVDVFTSRESKDIVIDAIADSLFD